MYVYKGGECVDKVALFLVLQVCPENTIRESGTVIDR